MADWSLTTYRRVLDAASDAFVALDGGGRIVFVNARTERLFGYRRQELMGQPVELLVPGVEVSGTRARLAGRRKDGSEFLGEISLSRVDTEDGPVAFACVRDITEWEEARDRDERQRAEVRFRALLEAAPDAFVAVDRDGRIALVNAEAERLFGYQRQQLLGQSMDILVPEAARALYAEYHAAYFEESQPRPLGGGIQVTALRSDGSECPIEVCMSAIEAEEGLLMCAAIRDISERLEVEAERERLRVEAEHERVQRRLRQSERLESLGQLAGGVAHDFNNLLAVILNYTAFVTEEVEQAAGKPGGEAWRSVQEDLMEIRRAAERAADLTRQLLAFGRGDVIRPKTFDLNLVVAGVEQLLRRTIGEHVTLVISLAPGLAPVTADPGRIEQVLVNLAVNARDAMPGGGTLSIDTANLVVDEAFAAERPGIEAGPYVRLRISDTGQGMSPQVLARAFEPFFTTKPKGEGTGLGLATVYGIITQAGGYASIYSEPGLGTTFNAFLPATDELPKRAKKSTSAHPGTASETVLVVEDAASMREVARRMLARNGYTVLTAASGHEAVQIASQHEGDIDLLLTDVVMPHMLGKEVAERVGQLRPGLRVLYMSGYAQPVFAAHGTLEPGVTLLEKPFSEAALMAKVRLALDDEDQ